MRPDFTNAGVEVQTFDEILDEITTSYKAIYGADIDLDQNTPDGQKVGIEAKLSLDLQTFLMSLYNMFDPDLSDGEMLHKVIKLAGMTAGAASQSSVVIDVTSTGIATLSGGFVISDGNNDWLTIGDNSLVIGVNQVTFYAEKFGNITASANTINEIKSINASVSSVNNPLAAVAGIEAETAQEIRERRQKSVQNPSNSGIGGLTAKILQLSGVTDAYVYENNTAATVGGIPANSIWAVIEGGNTADISEAIALNRTAGAGMKGVIAAIHNETFTRSDDTTFNYAHAVQYDVPVISEITIAVTATKHVPAGALDTQLIKNELVKKIYSINDDCIASELYKFGHLAGDSFYLSGMTVNTVEKVAGVQGTRFRISDANITVTVV